MADCLIFLLGVLTGVACTLMVAVIVGNFVKDYYDPG